MMDLTFGELEHWKKLQDRHASQEANNRIGAYQCRGGINCTCCCSGCDCGCRDDCPQWKADHRSKLVV